MQAAIGIQQVGNRSANVVGTSVIDNYCFPIGIVLRKDTVELSLINRDTL